MPKRTRRFFERFATAAQRAIVPGLRNSQLDWRDWLLREVEAGQVWLDLGCGRRMFPEWMPDRTEIQNQLSSRATLIVGMDVDRMTLSMNDVINRRVLGDAENMPFAVSTFDIVTANMVVEHVRDPDTFLAQVHQILKPGGKFLFHTTNRWGYYKLLATLVPNRLANRVIYFLQSRRPEDVFPTYHRMNSSTTIRRLAADQSFEIDTLEPVETIQQLTMLGPVVVLIELALIRLFRFRPFSGARPNLLVCLKKPESAAAAGEA